LRDAIASMSGVAADEIVVTCGGAEALFHAFFLAAEPGSNVVVPFPAFPTYHAMPAALGTEVRCYQVAINGRHQLDVENIKRLTDEHTRMILVNSPHNPTGAVFGADDMAALHDFTASRGIQLLCDEVFHPIYSGKAHASASALPNATVLGDLSKAFALPGLRIGWLREPDVERREQYLNAREYLSISNTMAGEWLATIAVKHRARIHGRTQQAVDANLATLDAFMSDHRRNLDWIRPGGGTTCFPRFTHVANTRAFCERAAREGLLLAPGDCFDAPDHVRIGTGVEPEIFTEGLRIFDRLLSR
jgi:aspartate/methionine/tyrosine aminotransferase